MDARTSRPWKGFRLQPQTTHVLYCHFAERRQRQQKPFSAARGLIETCEIDVYRYGFAAEVKVVSQTQPRFSFYYKTSVERWWQRTWVKETGSTE